MNTYDKLANRLRMKITLLLILRYCLQCFSILGIVLATIVLVTRMFSSNLSSSLYSLLFIFLLGILWAIYLGIKRSPRKESLLAVIDEHNNCGGILMSSDEIDIQDWQGSIPDVMVPRLKWNVGGKLAISAAVVTFIVFSYAVPANYVQHKNARNLDITEDVQKLNEQIDIMEEEAILEKMAVEELKEELEQIKNDATGSDPVKTWESLDHLHDSLRNKAKEVAESMTEQIEKASQSQMLAEILSNNSNELSKSLSLEAMKELTSMVNSAALENQRFQKAISPECLNACANAELSEAQLKELLKGLKECKGNMSKCMGKLCKSGLIDPKDLKACKLAGMCDSKELLEFLKENDSCSSIALYSKCAGRGGVNRGRADAKMTWTQGSREDGVSFKEQLLPQASLDAMKNSMLSGVSIAAPEVNNSAYETGGGKLDSADAGSSEAFTQTILPKHREAVKKYFKRD